MKSKLRLFEITSKKRWLNIKNRVLDHPDFHPTLPIPAPPSPPAPPARILSFLFSLVSNKVGSPPHALQPPWAGHDELSQSTLSISAFKVGVPPLSVLLSTTILLHPQFSDARRDPTRAPWAAPWPRWAGPPSLHHCRIFTRYQIAGQGHLLPVNDGKAMKNIYLCQRPESRKSLSQFHQSRNHHLWTCNQLEVQKVVEQIFI